MKLNELLGIEFPFIQGGMANIATAEFAAAVSNAGALGLIGAGGMSPEVFRDSIRRCRQLTDKPFGVNIMLMHPQVEELAAIAAEEKVAVVTTGAGDPSRFIPAWKEAGIKVFPVVPAVALAKLVAKRGADGVIAEGTESGGHVGETTTMALVPQVVDAVDLSLIHISLSAQKNLNLSRKIFHTSPKTIRGRLLSYLSYQSMRSGSSSFTIPFNRQQLADYLNVDRSALSNELSKMQRDGLIQVERNRFVLLGV